VFDRGWGFDRVFGFLTEIWLRARDARPYGILGQSGQRHNFNIQRLLHRMISQQQPINVIQSRRMKIPFTAIRANNRRHIFQNVQLSIQPVLALHLL
jgi:hypothetical protein